VNSAKDDIMSPRDTEEQFVEFKPKKSGLGKKGKITFSPEKNNKGIY
jgi:hypothetical protein